MQTQVLDEQIIEVTRSVPIVSEAKVVVCGGGPAGVAAALAAAHAQRLAGREPSVTLIEAHGQLGGVWTTGMLSWILDWGNKHGVMQDIRHRLAEPRFHQVGGDGKGLAYDPERMKVVLERACAQAGVKVRLFTRVCAVVKQDETIHAVLTESKSGREAWCGGVFVDATGDGDLAAQAGCQFEVGRPTEGPGAAGADRAGETQPMTMMALVTGIDRDQTADYHERADRSWAAPKDALAAEFARAGVETSYASPTIFEIAPDLYAWMINHAYGVSALSADDLTRATLSARDELHTNLDALRNLGGIWSNLRLVTTAPSIGVREGRRVRGLYRVTVDDLAQGRRHDDAICRVTFTIDVHSTNKQVSKGIDHSQKFHSEPYDVPYRALVAADVNNLLLAGRCISGDFLAHSSYRVTGNSVAMGEAAGIAAALCSQHDIVPAQLNWVTQASTIQKQLWERWSPQLSNPDVAVLASTTT